MMSDSNKASRGRPKTLDRDHIVDVALNAYWKQGIGNVSINEVCKKSKTSKPGFYREFGGEDGLMKAVLIEYQQKVLSSMLEIVREDRPFQESLASLVAFVIPEPDVKATSKGCLFVKMREGHREVGKETRRQIGHSQKEVLMAYEDWVERSKAKGEFSATMSSAFAAIYIDAQLSNAFSQLTRGEDGQVIKSILLVAFSMLG